MPHATHNAATPAPAEQARAAVETFLEHQQNIGLLRFITCGSVDDGKSTLIGRMLWESRQLFDDQIAALKQDSHKHGTQGDNIDFALLVDGLSAEREQGITIDVAYRFFATDRRKFIVADTPGHEQYTRNMVTAASTADVAIILVDARKGVLTQTCRHAYLASLMGIRHVVLAINKIDLVGYEAAVFNSIVASFEQFAEPLGFASITAIPVSALQGTNIIERSGLTPWYGGPSLMAYLETVDTRRTLSSRLAFPVQWVNRPDADFRGFAGTVAEGCVRVGNQIRVSLSGQTAEVKRIVTMDGDLPEAGAGLSITLTLDREIDASRGDVISLAEQPLETTDQFEAIIIWMSEERGMAGRSYDFKLASQSASVSITSIKHQVDINTLAHKAAKSLGLNDICVCNLATSKPVVFDTFANSPALGSFILIDRYSHDTVAAGLIRHSLRRGQNVHRQALSITRREREQLNGHQGKVIWFTGLSGSGKSTIANALETHLYGNGYRTFILDGDNIRQGINKDLGFTDADRVENIRRIAEVARLMLDAGLIVMTSFISPFRREREMARELIGPENFIEVYVSTPLEACEARDVKGLYKKARTGRLPNFSGIDSPYEPPETAEVTIDSTQTSVEEAVRKISGVLLQA
ncbi:MAG: sulfate adenylyltransferase subunit CysN [Sideroxydans sp.]|nr:sulfate adenylyltransferase subunit CysN [Sideroxydans sp.]